MSPSVMPRVSTSSAPRALCGHRTSVGSAYSMTSMGRGRGGTARLSTRVASRRRIAAPTRASEGSNDTSGSSDAMSSSTSDVSASSSIDKKKERKNTGELLSGLWSELKYVSLRDDPIPEAVDLLATINAGKERPGPGEQWDDKRWREQEDAQSQVAEKIGKYWSAKWDNLANSQAVRDAAPLMSSAVNVAIAGVLLRLALPRIAALQAVGGFDELADFFGLPPRAELSGYLDQLQDLNVGLVFLVYVGLFAAEKLTMTDEFLPIGFILPVVSPAVFGGVAGGTIITSLASTIAASFNFFLGRTVLKEKALSLTWKDSPKLGDTKWFNALSRRFDSTEFPESKPPFTEGFKSALLLRLCPILPIPLSGNWYVCGMTPLRFPEFFAAHFIGSSKTAFVDAYLGSLLLQSVFSNEEMEGAKGVLVFETLALVVISIGVTTYATDLFTQILEEEGIEVDQMVEDAFGSGDGDEKDEEEVTDGSDGSDDSAQRALNVSPLSVSPGITSSPSADVSSAEVSSPEEDATAKWAAEAFVASAVGETSDGNKGISEEELALLEAMDAAAISALASKEKEEEE